MKLKVAYALPVTALLLASLACQTLTRLSGTGPGPVRPTAVPVPESGGPNQPPQSGDAQFLPNGPTIGAARDARSRLIG